MDFRTKTLIFGSPAPKWCQIQIPKRVRLHKDPLSIRKYNKKKLSVFSANHKLLPSVPKSEKSKIIKLARLEPSKMASLTSFYQIKEVNTDMKTAQRDLLNEEESKQDLVIFMRF